VCYRCGAPGAVLLHDGGGGGGDACGACGARYERCMVTFAVLPLVQFELEPGLSEAEAAAAAAHTAPQGRPVKMSIQSSEFLDWEISDRPI
jgi:hypothetical protein